MRFPLLLILVAGLLPAQDPAILEHFEKKVRPLLIEKCASCHGAEEQRGGVRLDSVGAIRESEVLDPEDPELSILLEAVRGDDPALRMPPDKPLEADEIRAIERWIAAGAPMPTAAPAATVDVLTRRDHWSFQPPTAAEPPAGAGLAPIDRFIVAGLEKAGLTPAPRAALEARIRRLAFAITGLPPTTAELDLVEEQGEAAEAILLERWLESPHHAERWARHWLDLVRYSETRGHEYDFEIPQAWAYRDHVIEAFAKDLPYDQFVREHLAGDLLPEPRRDANGADQSIRATAWWFFEEEGHAPVDPREDQLERAANRVEVFGKTFLGLTVACARCHDHKFDPITAADYHATLGIVTSTSRRQVRYETDHHNRRIARENDALLHAPNLFEEQTHRRVRIAATLKQVVKPLARDLARVIAPAGDPVAEDQPLAREFAMACKEVGHPLRALLARGPRSDSRENQPRLLFSPLSKNAQAIVPNGPAFGGGAIPAGFLRLTGPIDAPRMTVATRTGYHEDPLWRGLKEAPGTQREAGALRYARAGKTMKTPRVVLEHGVVWHVVQGGGHVFACVDGHRMLSAPLHVHTVQHLGKDGPWRAVRHDLRDYVGRTVHFEYTASGSSATPFAVAGTYEGESAPTRAWATFDAWPGTVGSIEARFQEALAAFSSQTFAQSPDRERVATGIAWLMEQVDPESLLPEEPTLAKRRELLADIRWTSKLIRAAWDGDGRDEPRLARGRPDQPREMVARRHLEAIDGPEAISRGEGSGRLELAMRLTDGTDPLLARVWVNRVWHHLFGQGLVATVDNFGVIGEKPSHPELLDWLARRFMAEGWSTRQLIREIVKTEAFRRSSSPSAEAMEIDPENRLLHRGPRGRLEAEVIRDALLAVSGRLDRKVGGPSVPIHLTSFLQGRGRPKKTGPLDGAGRRSLYLSVRKNFLVPFLTAFDFPAPNTTVGRRSISNVPAQGLALLNDPFVHDVVRSWAERIQGLPMKDDAARIVHVWREVYGRRPSAEERAAAAGWLSQSDAPATHRWKDLLHALVLAPEFTHPR